MAEFAQPGGGRLMSYHCDQCPAGGRCARCLAGRRRADARTYARRKVRAILDQCSADDPWLLADDGIVDITAVEVASRGQRPVRLTRQERELAGMAIILRGHSVAIVISYLRLPVGIRPACAAGSRVR
jgi:hypothetical protein